MFGGDTFERFGLFEGCINRSSANVEFRLVTEKTRHAAAHIDVDNRNFGFLDHAVQHGGGLSIEQLVLESEGKVFLLLRGRGARDVFWSRIRVNQLCKLV